MARFVRLDIILAVIATLPLSPWIRVALVLVVALLSPRTTRREAWAPGPDNPGQRVALPRMPFHVTLILADAAQSVDNKLYILGGGWSIVGPAPAPSAIAVHIKVPWDQANTDHHLVLELLDSDGNPVAAPGTDGEGLRIESDFQVGRPAGLTAGTSIDLSLALNLAPIPLRPAGRYEWRLSIDGEGHEDWRLPFSTRPLPPGVEWPEEFGPPPE